MTEKTGGPITIFHLDDDDGLLELTNELLQLFASYPVKYHGFTESKDLLAELAKGNLPHVILMDGDFREWINGPELAVKIRRDYPTIKIIGHRGSPDHHDSFIMEGFRSLMKSARLGPQDLADEIERVLRA